MLKGELKEENEEWQTHIKYLISVL
jgi:hypothetical protein